MLRLMPFLQRNAPLVLAVLLAAGLALIPPTFAQEDGSGDGDGYQPLAPGTPAPTFTLEDLDGGSHSLSDLAGGPAVLVFFRGAW